ncbi:hypothetical protein NPIL_304401 [Nephila pilipes]|uniref:Uncharacterized protein n=1 Tax=Nephila pilipes TaxID=299642 RepID=A0A8X6Q5A1_NEPPI|nr:hypothetical protein NPIL_304401 [Nephila pilipes]
MLVIGDESFHQPLTDHMFHRIGPVGKTGCERGSRHQRCSRVMNGIDRELKERAHALSRQPTITLVTIQYRHGPISSFPGFRVTMVRRFQGDRVGKTFRPGLGTPLVQSFGHDAIFELEAIVAATKDRHPLVVEKNLGTGFFPR